jgi:hypothetical protein
MPLPTEGEVFGNYPLKINTSYDVYFLERGVHTQAIGSKLVVRPAGNSGVLAGRVGYLELLDNTDTQRAKLSRDQYYNFLKFTSGEYSFTASNYRDVKNFLKWKNLYQVQPFQFHRVLNNAKSTVMAEATFCRGACGIFLPMSAISIDHQKPQTGGEIESVLRLFRGFGLTKAGPVGFKNKMALSEFANSVGGKSYDPGNDKVARHTLSSMGMLYYSIFTLFNKLDDLKNICMHHYLNLRPMCNSCNSSRRNSGLVF